jgi:hypothetical protein
MMTILDMTIVNVGLATLGRDLQKGSNRWTTL